MKLKLFIYILLCFSFIISCSSESDQMIAPPTENEGSGDSGDQENESGNGNNSGNDGDSNTDEDTNNGNDGENSECMVTNGSSDNTIRIESEQDLLNFQEQYGTCQSIDGSLLVTLTGQLSTEEAFSNLRNIKGNLILLDNDTTVDLVGLNGLISIGGDFEYTSDVPINAEFESLQSIGGNFLSTGAGILQGFNQVRSIGGDFKVSFGSLSEISGFDELTELEGELLIESNMNLQNFDAFQSLEKSGPITFKNNPVLEKIDGLFGELTINGDFLLSGNSILNEVRGFTFTKGINGSLVISENPQLERFLGLASIEFVLGSRIFVSSNPSLSVLPRFVDINNFDGDITLNECAFSLDGIFPWMIRCGSITISSMQGQETLDGFRSLFEIKGSLNISDVTISKFDGFKGLSVIQEDLILNSLNISDTENFMSRLGDVYGDLEVSKNQDLRIFPEFQGLFQVLGNITISENANLEKIDGLPRMTSFSGRVDISNNPLLTEISSFNSLLSLQSINIKDNHQLRMIDGFQTVMEIEESLEISSVQSNLLELRGFGNLEDIGQDLRLSFIENLSPNFSFRKIENIEGSLQLENLKQLTNVDFLISLKNIGQSILINSNNAIIDLNGLSSVITNIGSLQIRENVLLSSIDGLGNIPTIVSTTISNNPNLSICDIQSVCNSILNAGDVSLSGNQTGCSTLEEVENACNN
nr:hypothetical protein [Allomuricauda sp.]